METTPFDFAVALNILLKGLGALALAGGGISLIAYGIVKFFGEKWINAKFEERLAIFKHAQERELEHLRFQISALMDRTLKLHQKEFDVLPEAWSLLTEAHGQAMSHLSSLQQYPDLDRMAEDHIKEFLEKSPLYEFQKRELLSRSDKTSYYSELISFHRHNETASALREFHVYFLKNGIFIPEPMKARFSEIGDLIHKALIEHEVYILGKNRPYVFDAIKALRKDGAVIIKQLEQDVQDRLWKSELARPESDLDAAIMK